MFSVVGAFGVRNNIADVYFCIAFGVLGFYMRRFGFPTAPMVLGVVLGPLAEGYFMTSMANYGDDWTVFFTRPKSGVLMALAAGVHPVGAVHPRCASCCGCGDGTRAALIPGSRSAGACYAAS